MPTRYQSPLHGAPRTRQSVDKDGTPCFVVRISELTPRRAQVRDGVDDFVGGALMLFTAIVFLASGLNVIVAAVVGGLAFIVYRVISSLVTFAVKKRTRVVLEADAISLPGFIGPTKYARNTLHSFQLVSHDDTVDEQLRHDLEVRQAGAKGKVLAKKAYFGQSLHVVLVYAGHRVDIAEVYGFKEAIAIINRLNFCDAVIDQAMNMGRNTNSEPEHDWPTGGPGNL